MMRSESSSPPSALQAFGRATQAWFSSAYTAATAVQQHAWTAIGKGDHTLVIAPTGSGKTLAAFLHAIDRLFREGEQRATTAVGKPKTDPAATRVLYLSPIKALAADVQRNLQDPLSAISAERERGGDRGVSLSVAIRSGDTTTAERARMRRQPPDILITTPESLFLMLTSNARDTLRNVHTVIIDEIHAVAGSKRGTHLALSLERLDAMLQVPAQRIGLSATVRPVDEVARFLGGDRPVTVVNPPATRHLEMRIVVPVDDMALIPLSAPGSGAGDAGARVGSLWPHIEASILDELLRVRSTIVFTNSRGVAEKLTARLNALYAAHVDAGHPQASGPAADASAYGSFNGGTAARSSGVGPLIARSHHGSVSKEQRLEIETALKSGALRCVVATSSLELGIDMGQVDLVIQVAAPPSVASALQRVGRAGHQVGGVSTGHIYPRTRRDLIDAVVIVDSMLAGRIEAVDPPRNPLDVLAQQTVAAVAMEPLHVDQWYARVRRAAPYRTLPRAAFDAVLDMLAGRYPSDDFAGFRPKLVWNRDSGQLTARPGARQLAVTSGGTIPDRGMFSVVLPEGEERAGSRRVGELDEEMVHESRINDVITLGATSWRVQQITHDQVIVTPAPGRSARLPFWRGENAGRPAELGQAIGAFLREFDESQAVLPGPLLSRLQAGGLDQRGIANLRGLLDAQREATGTLPTDLRLVVERCRDELGDWRVMLHSPYGRRVHDPWALAIAGRIRERWQVDPAVVASDDGIMVRLPDTSGRVPGAELFLFDPEVLLRVVSAAVGSSALFAARFRECASRALLLPRRTPGRRSPLWQQRLRAGQLLDVASAYPEFPILIETARECLQDVYDLPALEALMQRLVTGAVQLVEVTTAVPSPFAANLLFGYVAEFMYGTDAPLAERRASILSLDSGLLGDLLGQGDAASLLDPEVIAATHRELQRLAEGRQAKDQEGIADLLRELGPLSREEVSERVAASGVEVAGFLDALEREQRAIRIVISGVTRWAAIEDAARLRDALGVVLPPGIPQDFLAAVADPIGDLLMRFARTRSGFTTGELAARYGLGTAVVEAGLQRLGEQGKVLRGAALPDTGSSVAGPVSPSSSHVWVAEDVFRRLRVRSLQAARLATQPVPPDAFVRLLLQRHDLLPDTHAAVITSGGLAASPLLEGSDGLLRVVEQLAGVPLPVSVWENQILPARIRDYAPALLDALIATGSVLWCGHGRLGGDDGLVSLHLQETACESLPPLPVQLPEHASAPLQRTLLAVLADGGAFFARQLAEAVQRRLLEGAAVAAAQVDVSPEALHAALWELAWSGQVTTDIWAPLRALSGARAGGRPAAARLSRRRRRTDAGLMMMGAATAAGSALQGPATYLAPTLAGRWSLLQRGEASDTVRALGLAEALLDRHAVVTRGAAMAEGVAGGFPALAQVYRGMEDAGRVLRGRFVQGLGGAQFAERDSVDRLRALADTGVADLAQGMVGLSVADPANPFGSVLAWPPHPSRQRPVRRAGALVVIGAGHLRMYLAQGGAHLLTFFDGDVSDTEDGPTPDALAQAAIALATALRRGRRLAFTLERIDDAEVTRGPISAALRAAGFRSAPRGLAWEG